MHADLAASVAALSPFFPPMLFWIGGENSENIAKDIISAAQTIAQQDTVQKAVQCLRENPETLIAFQKKLVTIAQKYGFNVANYPANKNTPNEPMMLASRCNLRADIMVISAAAGLVLCLISLGMYKSELPGEAVGIISTIAGIFGACLKDAYAFEFGSSRDSKEKDLHVASILKKVS